MSGLCLFVLDELQWTINRQFGTTLVGVSLMYTNSVLQCAWNKKFCENITGVHIIYTGCAH